MVVALEESCYLGVTRYGMSGVIKLQADNDGYAHSPDAVDGHRAECAVTG